MSSGNKRTTQLVELTALEMAADDLLYVVDISAVESKKMTVDQLSAYLSISGSLSVPHAILADTASYVLGSNVDGLVDSSSYAFFASNATSASHADSASATFWALTSSIALTVVGGIGIAQSASWASSSVSASHADRADYADNAGNAAYLFYSGVPNGTASFALTASTTNHVTLADTASYWNNTTSTVASASWADMSNYAHRATYATESISASYLVYSQNNGSASFAIKAGSIDGVMANYGLFNADSQSPSSSILEALVITSSYGIEQDTIVEAIGNAIVSFTSSLPSPVLSMSLYMMDRITGDDGIVDVSNMSVNVPTAMGLWGGYISGTVSMPFRLMAQVPLYSQYYIAVGSSDPRLLIDPDRDVRFQVSSKSDVVYVTSGLPMDFFVAPSASVSLSFTVTGSPVIHLDYLPGFLFTGSLSMDTVNISTQSVTNVLNTWRLANMTVFSCSNNPALTELRYRFPDSLITLSCDGCSITHVANLTNTTASFIDLSDNQLLYVPELSISTSFLDVSDNPLLELPSYFPNSLRILNAADTLISGSVPVLPDGLLTASFANTIIDAMPDPLPLSMSYLDIYGTLVTTMSNQPISMSYLNLASTSFNTVAMQKVTNDLVANGYPSGTLDVRGYGIFTDLTIVTNFLTLTGSQWLILKD